MRFTDLTPEAIEQVLQEWAPASSRAGIVALPEKSAYICACV